MRKFFVLGMLLAWCSGAVAAGEATPPSQAATPAAAIARGAAAAARCQSMTWSTEDYSSCIDGAVGHAMDNDRDSTHFQLGVYCSAFFALAQAYGTQQWKQMMVNPDDARITTVDQYDSCIFSAQRAHRKQDQICSAVNVDCVTFNAELKRWQEISRDGM